MVRLDPNANTSTFDPISGQEIYGPRQLRTGKRQVEGRHSSHSSVVLAMDPITAPIRPLRALDKNIVSNDSSGVRSSLSHSHTTSISSTNPSFQPFLEQPQQSLSRQHFPHGDRPMSPYANRLRHSSGVADALGSNSLANATICSRGYLQNLSPLRNTGRDSADSGFGSKVIHHTSGPKPNIYHNSTSSDSCLSVNLSETRLKPVPMSIERKEKSLTTTSALNSSGYLSTV